MFRDTLRALMTERNVTAKDLAGMIETEDDKARKVKLYRSIENWTSKRASMPGADRAVAIAGAFGVTVEYLVTGKDSEKTYEDMRLLALARRHRKALEALDRLDELTLATVNTQIEAVAGSAPDRDLLVAEGKAAYGET